tara:strand:+ start:172 stop:381 length:210 start_codon:yes stop_codon:yes gene_type:complete
MIIPSTKEDLLGIKYLCWANLIVNFAVLVFIIILSAKPPNKTLSPAQEEKLNQATSAMQEVAEFIKLPK